MALCDHKKIKEIASMRLELQCMWFYFTWHAGRPQSSIGWADMQDVASLQDQIEVAKKDAGTDQQGAAEVAELKSTISTLHEKLRSLEIDLEDRGQEVRRLEALLQQSQALLAEKDAEIAILKVHAAAAFSGRVTPTTNLHIPSATSITGSAR